ncbi:MAG: peptidoglycan editing factor PgeF [Clostridia bacterium]|nr:peptidoglycan editing factor PgeF [Clostridia bacterium]
MISKSLKVCRKGDLCYLNSPKLAACGVVRHTFSTRLGGVSGEPFGRMNLSFNRGDERENVIRNYEILCDAVGIDTAHLVLSKQTHTTNVRSVTSADCGTGYSKVTFQDVDGLITDEPNVALVTQYADCVPLLFCDPVKRVIANSHSGWRGTAGRMGQVTVDKMVADYGCKREDIIAFIGPCIGPCCYEVDEPVYQAFCAAGLNYDDVFLPTTAGHYMLDLPLANRIILLESGISEDHLDVTDLCTHCLHDELHSHRATGGKRGNMAAIIELIPQK